MAVTLIPVTSQELQSYSCDSCKAEPGERCMTLARNPAMRKPTQPHESRWAKVRAARQEQEPNNVTRDPVVKGIVDKLYGDSEFRGVHFIYNALKKYTPGQPRNMWCSCHMRFGDDLDAAQRHLRQAHRIPEWLADLGIRNTIEGYIAQLVINGMLANDEDPTDRELFVKYRDWLLGGLGQQWIDRLDG